MWKVSTSCFGLQRSVLQTTSLKERRHSSLDSSRWGALQNASIDCSTQLAALLQSTLRALWHKPRDTLANAQMCRSYQAERETARRKRPASFVWHGTGRRILHNFRCSTECFPPWFGEWSRIKWISVKRPRIKHSETVCRADTRWRLSLVFPM